MARHRICHITKRHADGHATMLLLAVCPMPHAEPLFDHASNPICGMVDHEWNDHHEFLLYSVTFCSITIYD